MAEGDPQIDLSDLDSAANALPPKAPDAPAKAPGRWRRLAIMALVPLLVIGGSLYYWRTLQGNVTTDNAYVQQDKVSVSAEVGGQIVSVLVGEGQQVKAGDVLFMVDPAPYRIQIAQADAAIAAAQAKATELAGSAALSGADISAAGEDIGFAQARFDRQRALWSRGFTTKADYDAAQHQVAQARAELRRRRRRSAAHAGFASRITRCSFAF